jgi:hypothetical protein
MTFLLWLFFTALAAGILPGFVARQLTKGRGQYVEIPGKAVTWGLGSFLLVYLAVTAPWLVVSWTGLIDAPWLLTGLLLGIPTSAWASNKWYRAFKDGKLGGGSNRYLP